MDGDTVTGCASHEPSSKGDRRDAPGNNAILRKKDAERKKNRPLLERSIHQINVGRKALLALEHARPVAF